MPKEKQMFTSMKKASFITISLDHPDLSSLNERLDKLFTKKFNAKARLTKISVNDMIGLKNISMTTT